MDLRFHKNLYEQIQYETAHGVAVAERPEEKHWLPLLLWCAIPGAALLLFAALRSNQSVMDRVVFGFTTPLKHGLARLNDHIPFAVGELVWALALLGLLAFLVRTVILLVCGPERLTILIRRLLALTGAGLVTACCFTLLWGCNYYATSFAQRAGLSQRGATALELAQLTAAFAEKCNELAPQQERDSAGAVSCDVNSLFPGSSELYQGIAAEFPALAVERHDPKPMVCSRLLSLTGFSGFYFPMTAESIVNVDQSACMVPSTILHELAHQCNVAEEDAANFVAIIAGLRCDDPRFQYSSALLGYIHLSNALSGADRGYYEQVRALLNDQVRLDLSANDSYWEKFETPVADASERVYTGFLESYGHSEGMKSYGMCVNLLSGYYLGEGGRWSEAAQEAAGADASAQSAQQSAEVEASAQSAESAPAEQTAAQEEQSDQTAAEQGEESGKAGDSSDKTSSDKVKKSDAKQETKSDAKSGKSDKTSGKTDSRTSTKKDTKSGKKSGKSSAKKKSSSKSKKKSSKKGKKSKKKKK